MDTMDIKEVSTWIFYEDENGIEPTKQMPYRELENLLLCTLQLIHALIVEKQTL